MAVWMQRNGRQLQPDATNGRLILFVMGLPLFVPGQTWRVFVASLGSASALWD